MGAKLLLIFLSQALDTHRNILWLVFALSPLLKKKYLMQIN